MEEAKAHKIIYDDHEQAGDKYNCFCHLLLFFFLVTVFTLC